MALDIDISHYSTGTATVGANGTTVTGQGTTWTALRKGDLFGTHVGAPVRIAAVNSNTSLTLAYPWKGPAQTAAPYEIQRTPYDIGYLAAIEDLLRKLGLGALPELAELTLSANKLLATSGAGAMELADLSAFARTLLDDANAGAAQSTLGLTAGLLGASAPVPSAAGNGMADGDFNTLTAYGVYTIAGSWANGPTGTATYTGVCLVLRRSFNQVLQVVYLTNGQVWSRGNNSGAWGRSVDTSWFDPTNIPNSQLANIATARLKGRVSSGTGAVEDLTQAQVRTFLGLSSFMNGVLNSASGDALFTSMGKAQSTGANGYLTLPGGVMIQWGVVPFGGSTSPSVTFPTTFPNAVRAITANIMDSAATSTNTAFSVAVSSQTTSGFVAQRRYTQGTSVAGAGEAFHWIAIGY